MSETLLLIDEDGTETLIAWPDAPPEFVRMVAATLTLNLTEFSAPNVFRLSYRKEPTLFCSKLGLSIQNVYRVHSVEKVS